MPIQGRKAENIWPWRYNLFVFVYDKTDDPKTRTANPNFFICSFAAKERTEDYAKNFRLREIVKDKANEVDIIAYIQDKNFTADETTLSELVKQILSNPQEQGYLTISNTLQWRLQYQRIVDLSENANGITKVSHKKKN